MIDVKLIARTDIDPLKLASFAALECYQDTPPEFGKEIDVKKRLFDVGHHTTLEHFYLTYQVEGVAVGDVTFGLHLASPFYNTDQRSGRFCAKMFLNPDMGKIEEYIKFFWSDISSAKVANIIDYVKYGLEIYFRNIEEATTLAKKFIKEERPVASEKYIEANAPKFAQEQMRMFIPVIFPTGLVYTINLISLVALYESAWSPTMRFITGLMKDRLLDKFPNLSFMFKEEKQRKTDWQTVFTHPVGKIGEIKYKPTLGNPFVFGGGFFTNPESNALHPVDCLQYRPELMKNNLGEIRTFIEISVATMGQDQRHRTISRSEPNFTGSFYLPPLLKEIGLQNKARVSLMKWFSLTEEIQPSLSRIIAPYGAMVCYHKKGSFNAVVHEQMKRLCWCAQEEIYHLSCLLREQTGHNDLLSLLRPSCYKTGVCGEGERYCGRDIKTRENGNYFPERMV